MHLLERTEIITRKPSYRIDGCAMRPIFKSPTATFPEILMGFCADRFYEITAIEVLVGVANPQSYGRGGRRGSGMVPFERALVTSYRPS